MHLQPNPSQTTPFCKLKRVNPAFRSVSTLRQQNDLRVAHVVTRCSPHANRMDRSTQPDGAAIGLGWASKATGVLLRIVPANGIDLTPSTFALERSE